MADELNGYEEINEIPMNDSLQGYANSWQRALQQNEGEYCYIDFLIGTQNLVRKEGILYDVGMSFIVLYEPRSKNSHKNYIFKKSTNIVHPFIKQLTYIISIRWKYKITKEFI